MDKDNELKRPGNNNNESDPSYVSPDTSAPLGYLNDRPQKDNLDKEKVVKKAKGETPGNEVELTLNDHEDSEKE